MLCELDCENEAQTLFSIRFFINKTFKFLGFVLVSVPYQYIPVATIHFPYRISSLSQLPHSQTVEDNLTHRKYGSFYCGERVEGKKGDGTVTLSLPVQQV